MQIAAVAVIAASAVRILQNIISQLDFFSGMSETGGECISVLIKALGVAVAAQIAGDICRDNGNSAVAGVSELAAKATIIALAPAADKVGGHARKRTDKYLRDVYEMLESDCGSADAARAQYCRVLRS